MIMIERKPKNVSINVKMIILMFIKLFYALLNKFNFLCIFIRHMYQTSIWSLFFRDFSI